MSNRHLVSQVFEDVHLPKRPLLQKALHILNYFFAAIFSLEFLLKILGLGIITYFSSVWNCLDAFIVAVSITYTIKWGVLLKEWHRFHRPQGEGRGGGSELNRGTPTPKKPNSTIISNVTDGLLKFAKFLFWRGRRDFCPGKSALLTFWRLKQPLIARVSLKFSKITFVAKKDV